MLLESCARSSGNVTWNCPRTTWCKMTSGNVSGRDRETGLVVIKPSGYSYEEMTAAHMVVVDLDCRVVEGDLKPSTDTETHLYVYRHRPDVFGMVHTHSPYATSFAALGQPIPACLTASAMLGGEIPLGGYAPIGGEAIGQEIISKIGRRWPLSCRITASLRSARRRSKQPRWLSRLRKLPRSRTWQCCAGSPFSLRQPNRLHGEFISE
jgi:L-ribulose-5-phosphate 4-epimerase